MWPLQFVSGFGLNLNVSLLSLTGWVVPLLVNQYSQLLADLPLQTPYEDGIGIHVYHQYTLLSDRRDDIQAALQKADIACAVYYPVPLHQQRVFLEDCVGISLPVTEAVSSRCLSLPIFPELNEEQVGKVVSVIRSTFNA